MEYYTVRIISETKILLNKIFKQDHTLAKHFYLKHRNAGRIFYSNGKSSIVEERLYSFFFAFSPKKTKFRFFVFSLLHNY